MKPLPLPLGTILEGRYHLVDELGYGGFGIVYKAIDENLGCHVAVKETRIKEDRLVQGFEREARLLANLRHPALPKVTDFFEDDSAKFLVMEYIDGDDFEKKLKARDYKPFDVDKVLGWADKILAALEELHSYQPPIIHRDIKPSNLKENSKGEVVLLDFGLAKGAAGLMTAIKDKNDYTVIKGLTPSFASLEQIKGKPTTPRSDLFSLGATLWTLLTGKIPDDAQKRNDAVKKRQPDPLQLATDFNSQLLPEVAEILHKAMAIDPRQRLQSAKEMRIALREAIEAPRRQEIERARREEIEKNRNAAAENARQELLPQLVGMQSLLQEERNKYESELQQWQNRINTAQATIDNLQEKEKSARLLIEDLQKSEQSLRQQLEQQSKEHPAAIKLLEVQYQEAVSRIAQLEQNNESLSSQLKDATTLKKTLEDKLQNLSATKPTLNENEPIKTLPAGDNWINEINKSNNVNGKSGQSDEKKNQSFWKGAAMGAIVVGLFSIIGILVFLSLSGAKAVDSPNANVAEITNNNSNRAVNTNINDPGKNVSPEPPSGMVYVPGDGFMMGLNDSEDVAESPAHKVLVKHFFMDIYEVTNKQYAEFLETKKNTKPSQLRRVFPRGEELFPVVGVNWEEADDFCKGIGKRLPTEEEWEFAARGTGNFIYPWGNEWKPGNANVGGSSFAEVGKYKGASPFGIYDMIGNAGEWTDSDFKAYQDGKLPPYYAGKTNLKTIRGGDFRTDRNVATTTYRIGYKATGAREYSLTGFRCAKSVE